MSPHDTAVFATISTLIFGGVLGISISVIAVGAAAAADHFLNRKREQ